MTLLVAGALFFGHRSGSKEAVPASRAAAPVHEPASAPERQQAAEPPGSTAPAPALAADLVRAEKARLAADAEVGRIALREKRLDELDWSSPRPKPAVLDHPAQGKSERALPVEEKIRQTELVIQRLKERIAQSDQPAIRPASTAFDSALLTSRLQQRVTELERSVQALRDLESGQEKP
jgi:hypothetical protein